MRRLLLLPALAMLMLCGCAKKKAPSVLTAPAAALQKAAAAQPSQDGIADILVPVMVDEEAYSDMVPTVKEVSEDSISIDCFPRNFKEYISPERMAIHTHSGEPWCDFQDYPQLEFVITNNQDAPLAIQSLDIQVEESKTDSLPYLYVHQHEEVANAILIWNEAWEDWGEMSLDYKILRKDESFDGHYDRNLRIPFFKDFMAVDFHQDLLDMGYNAGAVKKCPGHYNDLAWLKEKYLICGNKCDPGHLDMPFLDDQEKQTRKQSLTKLFWPFEFERTDNRWIGVCGFARFVAKLSFDKSPFSKEISGVIYLTPPSGGEIDQEPGEEAKMVVSEYFDVLLRDIGENYSVRKPYSATIMPGESERISLAFKSQRSAIHQFRLVFNNENGLSIKSKKIQLRLINGRHSSAQPQ